MPTNVDQKLPPEILKNIPNIKNVTPEKWLNAFLQERGLLMPNSQILFKYQMTDAEYLVLKETLKFISRISEDVTKLCKVTKWNEVLLFTVLNGGDVNTVVDLGDGARYLILLMQILVLYQINIVMKLLSKGCVTGD